LERVYHHRGAIAIERSANQLEETREDSQRTPAVCNLNLDYNHLRDSRAALRRLEECDFGICPECDQDIHPKRLAAVPWVPLCIWRHEALDRNLDDIQPPSRDLLGRAA
jgi:RNA polymerase-binding transcription factor DksA